MQWFGRKAYIGISFIEMKVRPKSCHIVYYIRLLLIIVRSYILRIVFAAIIGVKNGLTIIFLSVIVVKNCLTIIFIV